MQQRCDSNGCAGGKDFLEETGERADLNQYWFSKATIAAMVDEITEYGGTAALVSSPSVYFSLAAPARARSKVLDFDRQWEADPGFVFYDFNAPEELPQDILHSFDFVLVDPPFITREVWEKYAQTTKLLLREGGRVLCTTIAENAPMMEELLNIAPVLYRPSIPNLVYQYSMYTNYASEALARLNPEVDDEDWRSSAISAPAGRGEASSCSTEAPIRVAGGAAGAALAEDPMSTEGVEASLPPGAALLVEFRELLNALKKATEALRVPLQQAVRRRAAEGDAAKRAAAAAEAALDAAEAAARGVQAWLAQHVGELGKALLDGNTAVRADLATGTDPWKVGAILELVAAARGEGLAGAEAYQAWALQAKQHSSALFRLSGSLLDRVKALKREAAAEAAALQASAPEAG